MPTASLLPPSLRSTWCYIRLATAARPDQQCVQCVRRGGRLDRNAIVAVLIESSFIALDQTELGSFAFLLDRLSLLATQTEELFSSAVTRLSVIWFTYLNTTHGRRRSGAQYADVIIIQEGSRSVSSLRPTRRLGHKVENSNIVWFVDFILLVYS